jgi:adenosylhomocysteine nucleosidase
MTLAIVSALMQEQAALREQLTHSHSLRVAGRDFLHGQLHGHSVVLALCGIGKVAAAITACALIERMKVGQILFTGVAGGLDDGVQVGDVVVASELLQHDMDASPIFPRYEVPLSGRCRFAATPELQTPLVHAAQHSLQEDATLVAHLRGYTGDERTPRIHQGLIVSGDRFVCTEAESVDLRTRLPDALAVEMEGAAVAQVCHDHGKGQAVIRTISDRADAKAHGDFARFVKHVASHYSERMVRRWLLSQEAA